MGLGVAGSVALGSAVLGAGASIYGSSQAAGAANKAAGQQQAQYATTRGDLAPYFQPGYNALSGASALSQLGPTGGGPDYLKMAGSGMTQAELEATPGYQFTLSQGLKSAQSAAAARGLGVSGAALKGAADYATGLSNKTYTDRFTNLINLNTAQQGNVTNQFNRLNSIATLGANAAAGLGTQGATLANQAGNYINQGGLATAAGTTGVSNALTGAANNYLGYSMLQNLINPTTSGYGSIITTPSNVPRPMPLTP